MTKIRIANTIHDKVNRGDVFDAAEFMVMFLRDVCDGTTNLFHQRRSFRWVQELLCSYSGCRRHALNGTCCSSMLLLAQVYYTPTI